MSAIVKWKPVTEDRYMEMLEILPPAYWGAHGFLVGEAMTCDSHENGVPGSAAGSGEDCDTIRLTPRARVSMNVAHAKGQA